MDPDVYWSDLYNQGRDFKLAASNEITKLLHYVSPMAPKTALDIGCGTGQFTRELYHRGYNVVGIDAATTAIQIARSLTVVSPELLTYAHFDIEHDDLSGLIKQPYGLVTCKLVYAFLRDKSSFLRRVKQLLAPQGAFVLITPQPEHTPSVKAKIVAQASDMELISLVFKKVAGYQDNGLIYFVGQ